MKKIDWTEALKSSELGFIALSLADTCYLVEHDNETLRLVIDAMYLPLVSDEVVDEIKAFIRKAFNKNLVITVMPVTIDERGE